MTGNESMNRETGREGLGLKELVAMGVGGMVGGGIFSVLGLSVDLAGHAAPVAFVLGGVIAFLTGLSYARLGLAFRSDGGSFTYLEHAFANRNVAGIGGWMLVVGYIGTMALYSFTFGVYGTALLGQKIHVQAVHHLLQSLILLLFMGVNLYGVKAAGGSEDLIVMVKVLILSLFAVSGLFFIRPDHLLPFVDKGYTGVVMGAALVFVAYEGFELIPNAVKEMKDPARDLGRGILVSIGVTIVIYILVSLVAVGNLMPAEIGEYKEYALAVAAKPFLGRAGFMLIGLAALLSTASAINATMFGTARLAMVMSQESDLPKVFSHRERRNDVPYVSLIFITALTLLFVNTTDLTIISSFASSTFLLLFAAVNLASFRLRKRTDMNPAVPLSGLIMSLLSWLILTFYLYRSHREALAWMGAIYLSVVVAELVFSKRGIFFGYMKGRRAE